MIQVIQENRSYAIEKIEKNEQIIQNLLSN